MQTVISNFAGQTVTTNSALKREAAQMVSVNENLCGCRLKPTDLTSPVTRLMPIDVLRDWDCLLQKEQFPTRILLLREQCSAPSSFL